MKQHFKSIYLCLLVVVCIISSCKKGDVPSVTTSEITNITGNEATSGGIITNEGSGTVIARGVCWDTNINPSIANKKTSDAAGAGSYISQLTELEITKTYFVRAYATNSVGTGYGMTMSFTTLGGIPHALTLPANVLSTTSATLHGEINANYISTTVTFEYGLTTSYGNSVTYSQNPVTGNADIIVSATVTGLAVDTEYHFRIKAVNELGTTYGEDETFSTFGGLTGYYNLEESTGTVLTQAGIFNGSVFGDPIRQQAGKNNYCYLFDGSSAINLGANAYRFTSDFTVSMWINTTSISAHESFFSRYFSSTGYRCYSAFVSPNGEIYFCVYNTSDQITYIIAPANSISVGQWYHIALVKSGTSMKIILNNSIVASTNSAPETIRDQVGSESNLNTFIGADSKSNTIPDTFFHGYIDEVAIWSFGLSDDQVSYIWNNGDGRFFPIRF